VHNNLSEELKKRVYLGEIRIDPHVLNPRVQCKYYRAEKSTILHSASWILKLKAHFLRKISISYWLPFLWHFAWRDKAILGT